MDRLPVRTLKPNGRMSVFVTANHLITVHIAANQTIINLERHLGCLNN